MKVNIFTEAGEGIGYGHLTRCISLYDELASRGIPVELIIYGRELKDKIVGSRKYRMLNWISLKNLKGIEFSENDICIIDSYMAEKNIYQELSNTCKKIASIDDYNRIDYPSGIVINPSIYTEDHNYSNYDVKYLLGKKYVILRNAFLSDEVKINPLKVEEILIMMGGSDIRRITPRVLSIISELYPNVRRNIVVGSNGCDVDLQSFGSDTVLYSNVNAMELKKLMLSADIAITAAGQTVYELMKIGTPFIPIQVIDNQMYTVKGLCAYNLVDTVIQWDSENFDRELTASIQKMWNYDYRLNLSEYYFNFIDGLGAKRIIDELMGS